MLGRICREGREAALITAIRIYPTGPGRPILKFRLAFSTSFGVTPGSRAYLPISYLADDLLEVNLQILELDSDLVFLETQSPSEGINSDDSFSSDLKFLAWPSLRCLSLVGPSTTSWIIPYIAFSQGDFVYYIADLPNA